LLRRRRMAAEELAKTAAVPAASATKFYELAAE
jgi:hypothetical protein